MEKLWQVTSSFFCAGLVFRAGICTEAAPILSWTMGCSEKFLRGRFAARGWRIAVINMP